MLIIIPCGKKKKSERYLAGEMYLGSYHRLCRTYADALKPNLILILSAKYGFLQLTRKIEPYELKMGDPGCITKQDALQSINTIYQSLEYRNEEVIALGGKRYVDICRYIWPNCKAPLSGIQGIGRQMQWLKKETQELRRQNV